MAGGSLLPALGTASDNGLPLFLLQFVTLPAAAVPDRQGAS